MFGPGNIAAVLAMAPHGKPRDHVHGKTRGRTHGNVQGKTLTWQLVPFWYVDPAVGPSHLAPYSHPQVAEV